MPLEKSVQQVIDEYQSSRAAKIAATKLEIDAFGLNYAELIEKLAEMDFANKELRQQLEAMREQKSQTDSIMPIELHMKKENITLNAYIRKDAKKSGESGHIFTLLFEPQEIEKYRAKKLAKTGGDARAGAFDKLEQETIRLYREGNWRSVPEAALEITPKIVKMSRNGNGDLAPTTTKPLAWIRAFKRQKK